VPKSDWLVPSRHPGAPLIAKWGPEGHPSSGGSIGGLIRVRPPDGLTGCNNQSLDLSSLSKVTIARRHRNAMSVDAFSSWKANWENCEPKSDSEMVTSIATSRSRSTARPSAPDLTSAPVCLRTSVIFRSDWFCITSTVYLWPVSPLPYTFKPDPSSPICFSVVSSQESNHLSQASLSTSFIELSPASSTLSRPYSCGLSRFLQGEERHIEGNEKRKNYDPNRHGSVTCKRVASKRPQQIRIPRNDLGTRVQFEDYPIGIEAIISFEDEHLQERTQCGTSQNRRDDCPDENEEESQRRPEEEPLILVRKQDELQQREERCQGSPNVSESPSKQCVVRVPQLIQVEAGLGGCDGRGHRCGGQRHAAGRGEGGELKAVLLAAIDFQPQGGA